MGERREVVRRVTRRGGLEEVGAAAATGEGPEQKNDNFLDQSQDNYDQYPACQIDTGTYRGTVPTHAIHLGTSTVRYLTVPIHIKIL